MNESITIVLPLPSRRLSPNCPVISRGGRIAKAVVTKKYRALAKKLAEQSQLETTPWKQATAGLVFYWQNKRRRDIRNAEAMMKAAYDGLVDAGVIADDESGVLGHEPTIFKIDRESPRVVMTISRGRSDE